MLILNGSSDVHLAEKKVLLKLGKQGMQFYNCALNNNSVLFHCLTIIHCYHIPDAVLKLSLMMEQVQYMQ